MWLFSFLTLFEGRWFSYTMGLTLMQSVHRLGSTQRKLGWTEPLTGSSIRGSEFVN